MKRIAPVAILMILLLGILSYIFNNNKIMNSFQEQPQSYSVNSEPNSSNSESKKKDSLEASFDSYEFIQISGKLSRANIYSEKYFTYTGGSFTVSLLKNNIQLLKIDDIVANPDLISQYNEIVSREKSNLCKEIKAADYYTKDSTGYNYLNDSNILFTNHAYDPIVSKITYIDYDNDERTPKDEWYQIFKQILINENKQAENTPVIFRESWSFNDNGNIIEIVTANNIVAKEENEITKFNENSDCYLEPIIPKYNELFAYKITVIFINGKIVNISKIISKIDKNHFDYPTDDKYIFTDRYKCYQYSKDGSVCACPLFIQGDSNLRNLICWDTYMYLDVDNDDCGELIELSDSWSTSWLPGVIIYEIDNCKLINSLMGV